MANAAHTGILDVSTDDMSYNTVGGARSTSFDQARDALDTTDFADGAYRTFIMGLMAGTVSIEADYEASDTAQGDLEGAFSGGTTVYVRWRPDGSNGFKASFYVTSMSHSGAVEDKATVTFELQSTGTISTVSA